MNNDYLKFYEMPQRELYKILNQLYENNGFYERSNNLNINSRFREFDRNIRALRTPVSRSVEFFVSRLSSSMSISTDTNNAQLLDNINKIWTWSNFNGIKSVALRQCALFGNLYLKVNANNDKVYFETIDPRNVSDLTLDNRGYIQTIRIDVPIKDDFGYDMTYTEYWNKPDGYFSIWKHKLGVDTSIDNLGDPIESGWLTDLGLDNFIPIVQVKFKDTRYKYGAGSVFQSLDKILEANKLATRLSDLLFVNNKAFWALMGKTADSSGRVMNLTLPKKDQDKLFEEDGQAFIKLPGDSQLQSLVPDINYADALAISKATENELSKDMPELKYTELSESSLSGKAIRSLLSGAIDRAQELQTNFISGLIRVNKIALSLAKYWGTLPVTGNYEDGDFDHKINTDPIFPLDESEKATMVKDLTSAGLALATSLRMAGYDQTFIDKAMQEKELETQSILSNPNIAMSSLSGFNSGV